MALVPTTLPTFDAPSSTEEAKALLEAQLDVVSALTTAVKSAVTEPAAVVQSGVRYVRSLLRGEFQRQFGAEWKEWKADGKIASDYGATDQARVLYGDLEGSLEDTTLDQEQLALLRKLFLAAAAEKSTNRNSPLPRMYLAIGRELSAAEIEILAQTYRYVPEWRANNPEPETGPVKPWIKLMQERTGLVHSELIAQSEQKLMTKGLLVPRDPGTPAVMRVNAKRYRFTDLGFAFCQFLDLYESLTKSKAPRK